jgi:hypothetical protein
MRAMDSHVVLLHQVPLIDVTLVFALPIRGLLLPSLILPVKFS